MLQYFFSYHAGSQKSVCLTGRALVWSLPANLVLAELWSRALPLCPALRNLRDAETLHLEPYSPCLQARASPAQEDTWMRSSVEHVCELKHHPGFTLHATPVKLVLCTARFTVIHFYPDLY